MITVSLLMVSNRSSDLFVNDVICLLTDRWSFVSIKDCLFGIGLFSCNVISEFDLVFPLEN